MQWDDLQVFLAVHRTGSHAGAARALRVDASTIGRRIVQLEAALGARLFDRSRAGLTPTTAGTALVPRAERVEAEVLSIGREVRGLDAALAGPVRLTASDGIAAYRLLPKLPALLATHPQVALTVRTDARNLDLSRREADVAVRLGRPTEKTLVARRLGALRFGIYGARGFFDRAPVPRTIEDLAAHPFVGFDAGSPVSQTAWLARTVRGVRFALHVSTTTAQVAACKLGFGLALLPSIVEDHEPLVPVLPRLASMTREVWAVTHQDLRKAARVALVMEWLANVLA